MGPDYSNLFREQYSAGSGQALAAYGAGWKPALHRKHPLWKKPYTPHFQFEIVEATLE